MTLKNNRVIHSALSLESSILSLIRSWAINRSKDPSTTVGACIYDRSNGSLHLGYNGFPKGIEDSRRLWNDRSIASNRINKYDVVVHAEKNAAYKALSSGCKSKHMVLFTTHAPCAACWRDVIALLGIKEVVSINNKYVSLGEKDIVAAKFFTSKLKISYTLHQGEE